MLFGPSGKPLTPRDLHECYSTALIGRILTRRFLQTGHFEHSSRKEGLLGTHQLPLITLERSACGQWNAERRRTLSRLGIPIASRICTKRRKWHDHGRPEGLVLLRSRTPVVIQWRGKKHESPSQLFRPITVTTTAYATNQQSTVGKFHMCLGSSWFQDSPNQIFRSVCPGNRPPNKRFPLSTPVPAQRPLCVFF